MDGAYKVGAFVEGWSSNTTILIVPDGRGEVPVYFDRLSHKPVGVLDEAGIGPGNSAVSDWSRPRHGRAIAELVDAAVRVGECLWRTRRMAGLFGLDALLTADGRVRLNEINCRNQGTTEVSAVTLEAGWTAGRRLLETLRIPEALQHPGQGHSKE